MKTNEFVLRSGTDGEPLLKLYCSSAHTGQRRYMEHRHTEIEISATVSGSCEWQVRHIPRRTCAGDLMLLGSDEEHYITSIDAGEPLLLLNLQFEPRFIWSPGSDVFDARYLGMFLHHERSFDNRLPAQDESARQVLALMRDMLEECREARAEYELIVKAKLLLLLGILGRRYSDLLSSPIDESGGHLRELDSALSYINANLCSDLSLDAIARSAGMSRSCFCAAFKRLNGISAWSYITKKRVELAARRLLDSDMSVTEIAGLCGYNTMANFNRSFRMLTGSSPREYRALNRK